MININDVMECVGIKFYDGNSERIRRHLKEYGYPYFNYVTGEYGLHIFDGEHLHIRQIIPTTYHMYLDYLPVYDAQTRRYLRQWR